MICKRDGRRWVLQGLPLTVFVPRGLHYLKSLFSCLFFLLRTFHLVPSWDSPVEVCLNNFPFPLSCVPLVPSSLLSDPDRDEVSFVLLATACRFNLG